MERWFAVALACHPCDFWAKSAESLENKGDKFIARRNLARTSIGGCLHYRSLKVQMQGKLNQPWTADGSLNESRSKGGRAVAKCLCCGCQSWSCALRRTPS